MSLQDFMRMGEDAGILEIDIHEDKYEEIQ